MCTSCVLHVYFIRASCVLHVYSMCTSYELHVYFMCTPCVLRVYFVYFKRTSSVLHTCFMSVPCVPSWGGRTSLPGCLGGDGASPLTHYGLSLGDWRSAGRVRRRRVHVSPPPSISLSRSRSLNLSLARALSLALSDRGLHQRIGQEVEERNGNVLFITRCWPWRRPLHKGDVFATIYTERLVADQAVVFIAHCDETRIGLGSAVSLYSGRDN